MKKIGITLGLLVPIILIATYVFFGIALGKVVKAGTEAFVPQVTKTPVSVGTIKISALNGSGKVEKFVLGNPDDFKSDYSISFESAELDVAPFSVLGDRILIEKIHVHTPKFNYERKLLTSNIKQILNNVKAASGRPVDEEAEAAEVEEIPPSEIKIEIRQLIIEQGSLAVTVGGQTVEIPMPRMELNNLGTDEGGIPPDEMAFEIISTVFQQVLASAGNVGGGAVDKIKGLFN